MDSSTKPPFSYTPSILSSVLKTASVTLVLILIVQIQSSSAYSLPRIASSTEQISKVLQNQKPTKTVDISASYPPPPPPNYSSQEEESDANNDIVANSEDKSEEDNENASYSSEFYDDSYEDDPCSPQEFWHIRGHRCVPFRCPRGNSLRNWKTGECLFQEGDLGTVKKFGKDGYRMMGFKNRNVLRPYRHYVARGLSMTRWGSTPQKVKVPIDPDTGNPIRTIGLIG